MTAFSGRKRRAARRWLIIWGIILVVGLGIVVGGAVLALSRPRFGGGGAFGTTDLVVVSSSSTTSGGGFFGGTSTPFDQSVSSSVSSLQGVANVSAELTGTAYLDGYQVQLTGIDPSTYSAVATDPNLSTGQFITQNADSEAVVGNNVATNLALSVGQSVTLGDSTSGGRPFTIVGVTAPPATGGGFGGGFGGGGRFGRFQLNVTYVSLADAQNITGQPGMVTRLLVRLQDSSQRTAVSSEISSIPGVMVLSPGAFGFGGRPLGISTILLIIGGVIAPIGAIGAFFSYRRIKKIDKREAMLKNRPRRGG